MKLTFKTSEQVKKARLAFLLLGIISSFSIMFIVFLQFVNFVRSQEDGHVLLPVLLSVLLAGVVGYCVFKLLDLQELDSDELERIHEHLCVINDPKLTEDVKNAFHSSRVLTLAEYNVIFKLYLRKKEEKKKASAVRKINEIVQTSE